MSDVLKYLGVGKYMAVKRDTLARLTQMSDRKLRSEIESLQHQGHRIVNLQDGCGYFIAKDEELEVYLKQEWHRLGKEMRKLHAMKKAEISAVTNE